MDREKGLAYCGLACCVCGESAGCAGCRNRGCANMGGCEAFACCTQKGYRGCWECERFPCENPMLKKTRVRAFARFVGLYGEQALLDALERNEKAGIVYHYPGGLVGDYDTAESEEAVFAMLGVPKR